MAGPQTQTAECTPMPAGVVPSLTSDVDNTEAVQEDSTKSSKASQAERPKAAKGWVYVDNEDEHAPDGDVGEGAMSTRTRRAASKKLTGTISKRKLKAPDVDDEGQEIAPPKKNNPDPTSDDEQETLPASVTPKKLASAFKGEGKAIEGPKKVKIEAEEKVLETTDVLKVKTLPNKCEVSFKELQDPALADVYDTFPFLRFTTRASSLRMVASSDVLNYDNDVPIFDGRLKAIDFDEDMDNIGELLPHYDSVDDEVPNGAWVGVGYTVSKFTAKDGKHSVSFNIKWVIVFGEPGEDQ
ncbi:hypothetical protein B0H17DRAFT_1130341 [Mycena rosella]|uniref:Uncharacterized protein n=1 Tax=Mycena rosella TaxID=1033263 RepID=A0AAD7DRC6_MYCRO|nr:hypothetical protein B0H17DRAFT_1130341 [Mycena rosella]